MAKSSRQSGFTLIELLVVIAIIGILSAVVLASLSDARQTAKTNAIIQELQSLSKLMQLNSIATPGPGYVSAAKGGQWIRNDGVSPTCADVALPGLTTGNQVKFREICQSMADKSPVTGLFLIVRWAPNDNTYGNHYTLTTRFDVSGNYPIACVGSEGNYIGPLNSDAGAWRGTGCYYYVAP